MKILPFILISSVLFAVNTVAAEPASESPSHFAQLIAIDTNHDQHITKESIMYGKDGILTIEREILPNQPLFFGDEHSVVVRSLDELKPLDKNNDNKLDANDEAYKRVHVSIHNPKEKEWEKKSLPEANVKTIVLIGVDPKDKTVMEGHTHRIHADKVTFDKK